MHDAQRSYTLHFARISQPVFEVSLSKTAQVPWWAACFGYKMFTYWNFINDLSCSYVVWGTWLKQHSQLHCAVTLHLFDIRFNVQCQTWAVFSIRFAFDNFCCSCNPACLLSIFGPLFHSDDMQNNHHHPERKSTSGEARVLLPYLIKSVPVGQTLSVLITVTTAVMSV